MRQVREDRLSPSLMEMHRQGRKCLLLVWACRRPAQRRAHALALNDPMSGPLDELAHTERGARHLRRKVDGRLEVLRGHRHRRR